MSSSPPVISFSCIRSSTSAGDKDTARNIRATKGFTVNIISEPWIQQANMCCIDSPPDVSEWSMSGLTREPSVSQYYIFSFLQHPHGILYCRSLLQVHVKAPRVKESAFSMECEVYKKNYYPCIYFDHICGDLIDSTSHRYYPSYNQSSHRNIDIRSRQTYTHQE